MITAIASGWMIRSLASRRASSAAAVAVVSSGYPIATRSAITSLSHMVAIVPTRPGALVRAGSSVHRAAGTAPGPHPRGGERQFTPAQRWDHPRMGDDARRQPEQAEAANSPDDSDLGGQHVVVNSRTRH